MSRYVMDMVRAKWIGGRASLILSGRKVLGYVWRQDHGDGYYFSFKPDGKKSFIECQEQEFEVIEKDEAKRRYL